MKGPKAPARWRPSLTPGGPRPGEDWRPKSDAAAPLWRVTMIEVDKDAGDPTQVHLAGPGGSSRQVPWSEFLRSWEAGVPKSRR